MTCEQLRIQMDIERDKLNAIIVENNLDMTSDVVVLQSCIVDEILVKLMILEN